MFWISDSSFGVVAGVSCWYRFSRSDRVKLEKLDHLGIQFIERNITIIAIDERCNASAAWGW